MELQDTRHTEIVMCFLGLCVHMQVCMLCVFIACVSA